MELVLKSAETGKMRASSFNFFRSALLCGRFLRGYGDDYGASCGLAETLSSSDRF
jgi:hypothetical protein